jgi:hypothetical protein
MYEVYLRAVTMAFFVSLALVPRSSAAEAPKVVVRYGASN